MRAFAALSLILSGCSTSVPATATRDAVFVPPEPPPPPKVAPSSVAGSASSPLTFGWQWRVEIADGSDRRKFVGPAAEAIPLGPGAWTCGVSAADHHVQRDSTTAEVRHLTCENGAGAVNTVALCANAPGQTTGSVILLLTTTGSVRQDRVQLLCAAPDAF